MKLLKEFREWFVPELKAKGKVNITGIGIFRVKDMRERKGVNPNTGEVITISARKKVAFSASKKLKDLFNA